MLPPLDSEGYENGGGCVHGYVGKGRAPTLSYSNDCKGTQVGESGAGSKASAIFHGKGDQDVRVTVYISNGLGGSSVRVK